MLTHWNKLLNTDCIVVQTKAHTVYPIFRVGYSTLMRVHKKKFVNNQIAQCDEITVVIREPGERFVSGVNEYARQHSMEVHDTWELIDKGQLHDRHFTPQYLWLMHLSKYHKGNITIRPFEYLGQITDLHLNQSKTRTEVPVIGSFVRVDESLKRYYNKTVSLTDIVRRYRHVLS